MAFRQCLKLFRDQTAVQGLVSLFKVMFRITAVLGSERQDTVVVAVDIQLICQLGGDCTSA